jgi:triacylglycerol lipase
MGSERFGTEPLRVERSADWERLELLEDAAPFFVREPFTETSRQDEDEIIAAFAGEKEPSSGRFILHVARAPAKPDPDAPPVLLVPGAVVDATTSFGRSSFKGRGGVGLAASLAKTGRQVFAITFAHPHGCNWLQSEQVANAIARIRAITGAARVDVVAHSKGAVAARLYASDLRKPGMTRFRGDIRRLVLIGAPNAGIDVAFAYPNLNYWVIHNQASSPVVWTEALCYGTWTNLRPRSLYSAPEGGGAFAGQAQMLRRWDGVYGLYRADPNQWDVETTYNGGRGRVSVSPGIDRAIEDGGGLMARLEKTGVDKRVEIALLAGTKPALMGFVGERRGPSDGLVLVRSALASEGLARAGAKIVRRDTLCLSHVELAYAPSAMRWIAEALGK